MFQSSVSVNSYQLRIPTDIFDSARLLAGLDNWRRYHSGRASEHLRLSSQLQGALRFHILTFQSRHPLCSLCSCTVQVAL